MLPALLLLPLLGAALSPLLGVKRSKTRELSLRLFTLLQTALSGYVLFRAWTGGEMLLSLPGVCGLGLSFRADPFRALYAFLAAFMWACAAQFSPEYFRHHQKNGGRYACFTLITLCGATGVFLSDDLYTAFVFFEIMSIASYPWVAHEETEGAMRAAATYLFVSVICGMVTLMGMFLLWQKLGTLSYAALRSHIGEESLYPAAALALVGYAAKAGMFPVHIWLPKAHPVAPAPASALLSGLLTKTGLFGVIAVGMNLMGETKGFGVVLLAVGLATMTLGAVLAVFSVNLKRTLACSSLSQIGYITVGLACAVLLGHHGGLAACGAIGHMLNHSLLKLCLFLCAGAVYMNAHTLDLTALRGFGRGKSILHIAFLLGALGLMGVPLFNGYASKTMIHEALAELAAEEAGLSPYRLCEWLFLFAAGLTTAYMLKLYVCLFWQKNRDAALRKRYRDMNGRYMTRRSALTLLLTAAPLPVLGVLPNQTLLRLTEKCAPFLHAEAVAYLDFFSVNNLKGGGISLLIGILVYLLLVRPWLYDEKTGYLDRWPKRLDLEELFYRPLFARFLPALSGKIASVFAGALDGPVVQKYLAGGAKKLARCVDRLPESAAAKKSGAALGGMARAFDELTDGVMRRADKLLPDEGLLTESEEGGDVFRRAGQRAAKRLGGGKKLTMLVSALLLLLTAAAAGFILFAWIRWGR